MAQDFPDPNENTKRSWYAYKGIGFAIDSPSNYIKLSAPPACLDGSQLCAIYAAGLGGSPDVISDNIKRYIADGITKFVAQPNLPIDANIFVVLKNTST